ncbi:Putative odorant receptor 13a [Trachymyrmex zeteki]|uniref:Putative odorant receptor 13a n=1 Tax=Mycetomoellerius zeteki TaxID=64791 RepID=A0A151X256_9HYME|nr:Putative odorant receptor 13a [Trachymyrmex zeteki]
MIASFFMLGFMCIPQSTNLVFIWGDVDMMTENLATANIPVANSFMKAFTIWRRRKVLKLLVNFFYQDWYMPKTSEERTIMLKNAKIVRKISIWCTILTQIMVTIYIVLRISTIIRFSPNDPACPMLYTAYFPFDITRSPIFELICICQILSAYSATVTYTGTDSFISMLVLHVCGQFENLRERLKNLVNDSNGIKTSQEFKSELRQIVMRHEHLNWFAKTIEESFNMMMLIQMLSCTVQLCFQGFQVFTILINEEENESMTFQLIFLISFVGFVLVHLYVYCYVGEMLLVQIVRSSLGYLSVLLTVTDQKQVMLKKTKLRYSSSLFHISILHIHLSIDLYIHHIIFPLGQKCKKRKYLLFKINGNIFHFLHLNFAFGWNRFNLSLVGIWPDPLQSPKQKSGLSRCRFMIASFFMLGFVCIPQSANLIFIWGNVDMMTENLATANIPVANSFMKAFTIWRKRKGLSSLSSGAKTQSYRRKIIQFLKLLVNFFYQDWYTPKTSEERTIMLKNAKLVRKISICCTILTQTLLIIYIVLKISVIIRFSPGDPARPMIYTVYYPFDATKSPIFELICACQILSAFSGTVAYTGSDSFISMLVLHVCGQFENLRERLKNLVNDSNEVKTSQEFKSELRQIVMRHEHLNWFAKTIEDSFNMMLLIQILSCTVQLCFQGFQVFRVLINEEENESMTFQLIFLIIFVGFILVHLYIYCYVGEMLLVQSTEIGLSAYESNWFNMPGKEARNLLLIMHRSTIPLYLTAGKFSTFSLQMFSKIVRSSLGYLSVLLTVTERKE